MDMVGAWTRRPQFPATMIAVFSNPGFYNQPMLLTQQNNIVFQSISMPSI